MTDDNNGAIHTDFVRGQRARDGGAYTPALRWGIDLSIGSVMAVANVLAARTMNDASFGQALLLAVAILAAGAAIGAANGLLVIVSQVPDVIVTLTSGFIWGGIALLILEKPGGGAPPEFANLGTGTVVTEWLSSSLVLLVICLAIVWTPVRIVRRQVI
jgi:ribose transport system permease protein